MAAGRRRGSRGVFSGWGRDNKREIVEGMKWSRGVEVRELSGRGKR